MTYTVDLGSVALRELGESFDWYEEKQPGLGERFLGQVNKRISEITQHPERYPVRKKSLRQALVETFPFLIVYEILEKEKVIFVAHIFHTRRNPSLKYRR